MPSDDRHIAAAGIGYRRGRHAVDVSYSYSFYQERQVVDNVNPRFNGTWDIGLNLINLSYTYGF